MNTDQIDQTAEIEAIEAEQEDQDQSNQIEKKEPPERVPATVQALEGQYLDSTTLEGRYRLANAFMQGGMVPKSFKSPGAVLAGMEFARELGIKPLTGLRNIAVINGQPSIWGDLPLALVRRSGKLEWIEEFVFDEKFKKICFDNSNIKSKAYGAICRTKRKGDPEPVETWFTMDDAKTAGLLSRDNVWKTYPRRMLQMRARSQNLKDNFSDALTGVEIAEYDYNYMPQNQNHIDAAINRRGETVRDVAAELNESVEAE